MKYWRGYLAAAIFAAVTGVMMSFAKAHSALIDMIYPYATRLVQTALANWSAGVDFCLWQLLVVLLGALLICSIVLMIVLKWNPVQWLGWVLAAASLLFMLHTGIYGLNTYSGPLAEDIRLNVTEYTATELIRATAYYRDRANELSAQVPRDAAGNPQYPSFEELAEMAGDGFHDLTYRQSYSVFAGSVVPVKKLSWSNAYSSMGIAGISMALTGEAAVNPEIPVVSMPFTMCHEMAHRMCISNERDANMTGFLACDSNPSVFFQYSAYFMAFRYCYNALAVVNTSTADKAAREIYAGINDTLKFDLDVYRVYLQENIKDSASALANTANDTYIKVSGDENGVRSYGDVCDLLVSWHVQKIWLPEHKEDEFQFDPFDRNQVDLDGEYGGR